MQRQKGEWAMDWRRSEETTSRPFEVEASRERRSQSDFLLYQMSPGSLTTLSLLGGTEENALGKQIPSRLLLTLLSGQLE